MSIWNERICASSSRLPGDDACGHVVMAVQIFRPGFADEVGAERERAAEHRRREGVVHDQEPVAFQRGVRRDVRDGERGVRDRLDVAHRGGALPGREVGHVRVDDLDPERLQAALGDRVGRPVELGRAEQRVARRERRHERGRDRRHARRERERFLGAFESGERAVQLLDRRVADAGVDEAVLLLAHHPPELGRVLERERGRGDDRHRHRDARRDLPLAAVDGARGDSLALERHSAAEPIRTRPGGGSAPRARPPGRRAGPNA